MDRPTRRFLEFGRFRIDTGERCLVLEGQPVALTPKVFDLLLLLVENRGHTLSKDELMERIWPDSVVEENSLTRNVSLLRKTLGDGNGDGTFIRTVPKRGYRFEAEVRVILEDEEELVVEKRTNYSLTLQDRRSNAADDHRLFVLSTASRSLTARLSVAVILVAAAVAALAWAIGTGGNGGDRNLSAESDQAPAFAEAVELYRRGRDLWKTRSAADLHQATLLLEQAVEKDPNFAPAYAALADAYAFDTGNWKKVQATANRAIELDPSIGEPLASIGFTKFFWEWRTAEAESYFRKSLMLSPDYATAHQWYAVFLASDGQFNQALAEINRALELEPEALAARADLCQILYFLQRYDDAEIECRRVLEVDERFFAAHSYLYDIYTAQQRYDEAVNEFFTTERLAVNHSTLPQHLDQLKTAYDNGGIRAFWRLRIKTLDKPPGSGGFTVGKYYARLGENEKAMAALRRASEKPNFDFPFLLAEPVFRNCCLNDAKYRELLELWASRKNEDPPDLIR